MKVADCLFCRIAADIWPENDYWLPAIDRSLRGEAYRSLSSTTDIVWQADHVVAFRDSNPAAPTHIVVIPRKHFESLADPALYYSDVLAEMMRAISSIVKTEDVAWGYRIVMNIGPDAGQSVQHLHFHLLGGRMMSWPPG